jgi:hypothetical protein
MVCTWRAIVTRRLSLPLSKGSRAMTDKLLEPLLNALQNGNWGLFFVVIAIALIINLRAIQEFLEYRESRHERFVKEAIKIDSVDPLVRSFLAEELDHVLFKRVTGISADRALREKIKDLVDRSGGELKVSQIAKAKSHVKMKSGRLLIEFTAFDKFHSIVNYCFAIVIAVYALIFFMLPSAIKGVTIQQLTVFMLIGILLFFFSLFIISQTSPYQVARKLKPIIESLETQRADNDG